MRRIWILFMCILPVAILAQPVDLDSAYQRTVQLMGCRFDFTVVATNPSDAERYLNIAISEIKRIEDLISSWKKGSQTSRVNVMAGIEPVQVDRELIDLVERSVALSKLTDGAFDITYASLDPVWRFDGSMEAMPDSSIVAASVDRVGFEKIVIDRDQGSLFLPQKGMKIGFGAIGKGYAADRAKKLLIENGCKGGIVNASGDLSAWGAQPNGEPWQVAIVNPLDKERGFARFPVRDQAVVTSGDYEKFVSFNGVRYAHIIDPRTGYPATGIVSVTVFAPKAELADALATSVFVMGSSVGIDRINQLDGVECIVVDEKGQISTSENIQIEEL